jgi:hypothetical protein
MKILVLWAAIFVLSLIAPANLTAAFMLGFIFGAYWMHWMTN